MGTMQIDYTYMLAWRRLNAKFGAETLDRHFDRIIAAIAKRAEASANV
jgi:hypothetical protein